MFITQETVETVLQRIYSKVGIHSRARLHHWLAEERDRLRPSDPDQCIS